MFQTVHLHQTLIVNSNFFKKINEDIKFYLTTVKPLKFTSILKIQQDDSLRKSKRELEISNAKENISTNSENPENKKEIQLDDYTRESMAIMADYINLISNN